MLKRVESASPDNQKRLVCVRCRKQASFISPIGLLCQTDALLAAVRHGWIPRQVKEADLANSKAWWRDQGPSLV